MITNINTLIANKANDFIGQKEIKGNMGFLDKEFQEYMKTVGWEKGHAWCAYFTELVWKLAYAMIDSTQVTKLDKLFSANVMQSWANFQNSLEFKTDQTPEIGSLVVWNSYKAGESTIYGHIGIVTDVSERYVTTVEGNTNSTGGREGIEVAKKSRLLKFDIPQYGLRLLGFIHPMQV